MQKLIHKVNKNSFHLKTKSFNMYKKKYCILNEKKIR